MIAGLRRKVMAMSGREVKAWRKALGLNQSCFWRNVFVTQPSGSRYEAADCLPRSLELLIRLVYCSDTDALQIFKALRRHDTDSVDSIALAAHPGGND